MATDALRYLNVQPESGAGNPPGLPRFFVFDTLKTDELDNQVPQHQHCAQSRGGKESVAGWTPSLGALLELFVPLADTLRRLERVCDKLVDVL